MRLRLIYEFKRVAIDLGAEQCVNCRTPKVEWRKKSKSSPFAR